VYADRAGGVSSRKLLFANKKYRTADLKKERVGTLKRIIKDYGKAGCKGCSEKSDYIAHIMRLQKDHENMSKQRNSAGKKHARNLSKQKKQKRQKQNSKPKLFARKVFTEAELKKLRVGSLKRIIADLTGGNTGGACPGCTEKGEFVRRILDLQPKPQSTKTMKAEPEPEPDAQGGSASATNKTQQNQTQERAGPQEGSACGSGPNGDQNIDNGSGSL